MAELRDLRAKITVLADQVIEAMVRNTGREKQEIARQWLHERAVQELAHAEMITRLTRGCEGGEQAHTPAGSPSNLSANREECR